MGVWKFEEFYQTDAEDIYNWKLSFIAAVMGESRYASIGSKWVQFLKWPINYH